MPKKHRGHGRESRKAPVDNKRFKESVLFHELRLMEYTHREIADLASSRLGYTISADKVSKRLAEYRNDVEKESAEELREYHAEQLRLAKRVTLDMIAHPPLYSGLDRDGNVVIQADQAFLLKAGKQLTEQTMADATFHGTKAADKAEVVVNQRSDIDREIEALLGTPKKKKSKAKREAA